MLNGAIGDLLPSALAVALSPFPVVAAVGVLGGRRARTAGPAFAGGWIAGLAAVSVAVVLLVNGATEPGGDGDGLDWWKIAVGVVFLALAAKQWAKRPQRGEPAPEPSWMAALDRTGPGRAAVLGAALAAANPKNLALTLTAAASIAEADLDPPATWLAVAAFVAIGSATVAGAVLFHLLAGDRAAAPLGEIRRFMAEHNAAIMTVVLLLLGAKLLGDGLGGL